MGLWPGFRGTPCFGCFAILWKFVLNLWSKKTECCFLVNLVDLMNKNKIHIFQYLTC